MKRKLIISIGLGGAILIAVGLCFLVQRGGQGSKGRPVATPKITLPPGERLRDDWPAEEVFRRAFWRQPTSGDKILNAIRLEGSSDDGVKRWGWFIKLHPSAELLGALRDPATFGLLPTTKPHPFSTPVLRAPDWYQPQQSGKGTEILQHPTQPLTLHYRASDNLLFASDQGNGFAESVSN